MHAHIVCRGVHVHTVKFVSKALLKQYKLLLVHTRVMVCHILSSESLNSQKCISAGLELIDPATDKRADTKLI